MISNDTIVSSFLTDILPNLRREFTPEKVILFGSRICGNPRENSDLDVVIISERFEGVPFIRRMPEVAKKLRTPYHVDYLCYSDAEIQRLKDRSSILAGALSEGVEV